MSIKSLSLSALALTLALSQTPAAFAHESCDQKEDWMLKMSEKLSLDADQKSKLKSLSEDTMKQLGLKKEEMKKIHANLDQAFEQNNINMSQLDDFVNQEQQSFAGIAKLRLKERFDLFMMLNDKQKTKMSNLIKEWKASHMHKCD